ncbi:hypothetical protein KP509_18G056600 [Ceratopteris richardii]|uniref:UDP-glucose/GDP-mannose dehydrogenase C-terminal domain-containing protein n=1 Tax=Ceratopteris richardii TaxID=49495 RepID=A0A8T2SQK2_CERRI|nr:hypothetical protein KP509_18G056600 [Ceratopteris richardii]
MSKSTDVEKHVADADIIFVSVNTRMKRQGLGTGKATDLAYWESSARLIVDVSISDKIVVEKSTVPVKTIEAIERILTHNSNGVRFQILSNPEFLAEGTIINNLLHPDRVLIDGRSTPEGQAAVNTLVLVYAHWVLADGIISMGLWSTKISKPDANVFLAQRISSINIMCALCEATSADVTQDILNLVYICECNGLTKVANYCKQVVQLNDYQKSRFVKRIVSSMFNRVAQKKMVILGFAFQKDTGDTRETPAIGIRQGLLRDNVHLTIYDSQVAKEQIRHDLDMDNPDKTHGRSKQINIVSDVYEATKGAHGHPSFIFDGQNMIDADIFCKIGFIVYSIGNPLDPWLRDLPVVPPS